MILGTIFFQEREKWNKDNKNPFGGPAVGSPHWLDFKGLSPARSALIYGHLKWPLTPLFCSYFLFSCQPFQQSRLFWNSFSSGGKEVWFIWIQNFLGLLFCVCNNIGRAGLLYYNAIFFTLLWIPYFPWYYFFLLIILIQRYP